MRTFGTNAQQWAADMATRYALRGDWEAMLSEYAWSDTDRRERARLDAMAPLDPSTCRFLAELGVGPGWCCAEVGAGAGSIAAWLHNRVGDTGRVVATDLEIKWVEQLNLPGLEVHRHDIARDQLGDGEFDLVHMRNVLVHVRDWEVALNNAVTALRPGGWLVAEESDFVTGGLSLPPCQAAERFWAAVAEMVRLSGGDTERGRGLGRSLAEAGLVDIRGEARVPLGPEMNSTTIVNVETTGDVLVDAGLISKADLESVREYLRTPGSQMYGPLVVAWWGRRPE
jgi:SAM-dependent methyltransferase